MGENWTETGTGWGVPEPSKLICERGIRNKEAGERTGCRSPMPRSSGFQCCGPGVSVEMARRGVGDLQAVVSDCGVASFVAVDVLVLHPGCRSGRGGSGVALVLYK